MSGFLKVYRDEPFINESFHVDDGKAVYDRFHAWVDLRMRASYYPRHLFSGGRLVSLDEGELIFTLRELAASWGWSVSKVRAFIDLLERAGIAVVTASDRRGTRLIINDKTKYAQTSNK